MTKKVKLMECKSCGAHFDEMLPACPYCGTTSIKGAQAQYMEKLENIREDMEALTAVAAQETKKALKKQTKFVLLVLGVILGLFLLLVVFELVTGASPKRDRQADYAWQQENFPILDELYRQENYEELLKCYEQALLEDAPISVWEHYTFLAALDLLTGVKEILEREQAGEALAKWDYENLLYAGFRVETYGESTAYSAEELEKLKPYIEMVRKDFSTRFSFTQEEQAYFEKEAENNYGLVPYKVIEKYIEEWMEKENQ